MTLCTDFHWRGLNRVAFKAPQNLRCLGFDLFFFTADVRKHVVENVERGDARIASTRNGLECCGNRRLNTKCEVNRCECEHQTDCRAVRICDDVTTRRKPGTLTFQ